MGNSWSTDSIPQYSMLKLNSYNSCNSSDMPWMQNTMPVFNPTANAGFPYSPLGSFSPGAFGWGNFSGGSSSSSGTCETLEEYQEKEKEAKKKQKEQTKQERETKELTTTGLGVTKEQLEDIEEVAYEKEKDEHKGMSLGQEVGSYTAMGAMTGLGMSPIANSRTYLIGEHNKLFSRATDIYTHTDANGKAITYNRVYKSNAKIMSEAKAAMRKAERLANKAKWKNRLSKNLYKEMSAEMKKALETLARDPKNEAARTQLKNVTQAINKTTSQRVGWVKGGWKKIKNYTKHKLAGSTPSRVVQPTRNTFKATLQTITNNSTQAAQTTGAVSKGASILKGAGKLLKKTPWLVGVFEVFMDKDKIEAAYKKDSSTGNKQLVKTGLKACGAMAGMALGMKAGALIGSVVPGAGTVIGGVIGALAGAAIGGLCSWLGRKAGEAAGDALLGKEDVGSKAIASNITKANTEEQVQKAIETATWARENKDKLSKEQIDSIKVLDDNLVKAGLMQPLTA